MSLSLLVYARYLSGYSPLEIAYEMQMTKDRVVYTILRVGIEMSIARYMP